MRDIYKNWGQYVVMMTSSDLFNAETSNNKIALTIASLHRGDGKLKNNLLSLEIDWLTGMLVLPGGLQTSWTSLNLYYLAEESQVEGNMDLSSWQSYQLLVLEYSWIFFYSLKWVQKNCINWLLFFFICMCTYLCTYLIKFYIEFTMTYSHYKIIDKVTF